MDVMHFTGKEKSFLLKMARDSIVCFIENKQFNPGNVQKKFMEKSATFVTLYKNGRLRGCIGSLIAARPLYQDVILNAVNAAFFDPRFNPVAKDELSSLCIEISILSKPRKLEYVNNADLLRKLKTSYGIIIKKGYSTATFLPQVW